MSLRTQAVDWLKRYTGDAQRSMMYFTQGGFLFAGGLMVILLVQKLMQASIQQELAALVGLILASVGAAIALWGYLGISLFKILIYLLEPRNTDE